MFYQGKKVLVTGGTGFVGMHYVEELLNQGAHVTIPIHNRPSVIKHECLKEMPGDMTVLDDCRRLCRGVQYVFHCGGTVSSAGVTARSAMAAITLNLVVTANTLQACGDEGVERVLIFSSSTAYPEAHHAIKEDEMWSAPPFPGYFGYAWMRRYTERLCEFIAQKSPLKIALLRPTAVYGRFDGSGHVIPSLIRRVMKKPDPFVVWGDGNEVRDFLHVTDLARGGLLLLEKHAYCDPVNIGYSTGVTVRQCLGVILKTAGHDTAKLIFDTTMPSTIPFRMVDITKARQTIGFEPQVKLDEGLFDTVKWYMANPNHPAVIGQ
jgi:GDP-L-fucose synthase